MTPKHLIASLVLASAIVTAPTAQDAPPLKPQKKSARDSILFKNGDVLFGALQSIDAQNGIRWNRSDALSEFSFAPEHISQLELSSLTRTNPPASSNLCQVILANGDQLQGDLISYDGEKLTLDTWFAGTIELPKAAVALITPLGLPNPTLFAGPTGTEGWTMGRVQA